MQEENKKENENIKSTTRAEVAVESETATNESVVAIESETATNESVVAVDENITTTDEGVGVGRVSENNSSENDNTTQHKLLPSAEGVENPELTGNTERQLATKLVDTFDLLKENASVTVEDVQEKRVLAKESKEIEDHNNSVRQSNQGDILQVQGNDEHNTLSVVYEDPTGALRHEVKSSRTPEGVNRESYYDDHRYLWGERELPPSNHPAPNPESEDSGFDENSQSSSSSSESSDSEFSGSPVNPRNEDSEDSDLYGSPVNPRNEDSEDSDLYGSPVNPRNEDESNLQNEDQSRGEESYTQSSKRKRDSDSSQEDTQPLSKKVNKDDDDEPKGSGLSGSGTGSAGGTEGHSGGIFRVYLDISIISLSTIFNTIAETIDIINNIPY